MGGKFLFYFNFSVSVRRRKKKRRRSRSRQKGKIIQKEKNAHKDRNLITIEHKSIMYKFYLLHPLYIFGLGIIFRLFNFKL